MDYQFLTTTALFKGLNEKEIEGILPCLKARVRKYRKGSIIFHAGDQISEIGLVLSGSVNIVVTFYWGSSNIFGHVGSGDLFAENYAAIPGRRLLNDVITAEETEILFLSLDNLLFVNLGQTIDIVVFALDAEVLCQVDNLNVGGYSMLFKESLALAVAKAEEYNIYLLEGHLIGKL